MGDTVRDRLERQPWGEHGVWRWEGNGKQSRTGAQKGSLGLRCPLLASEIFSVIVALPLFAGVSIPGAADR